MIVFDKAGHEINMSISDKLSFDQFKKDYKNLNIDFKSVYQQLTGKKVDDTKGATKKYEKGIIPKD